MPVDIKLPALSESINEGTVSEVRVKPGDTLKPGDIVVVVEAEKSVVEVPADSGGKVTEVLARKGDTVKVGQTLARVESGAPVEARVHDIENHGIEKILTLRVADQLVRAGVPGRVNVAVEDTIRFGWNPGKVILFDANTGINLAHAAA